MAIADHNQVRLRTLHTNNCCLMTERERPQTVHDLCEYMLHSWPFASKDSLELRHGAACGARQQQFDDSDDVEYDALPIRFHTLSL